MAQELIDIGALADDGTGDTIRNAGRKINANFTEVYARCRLVAGDIRFRGNTITSCQSLQTRTSCSHTAGTGNVCRSRPSQFEDNNIKPTRSNDDLKITRPTARARLIIGGTWFQLARL